MSLLLTNTVEKQAVIDHLLGYLNESQEAEGKGQGLMHNLGYLDENQFIDAAKQFKDNKFLFDALVDITKLFDARYDTKFFEAIIEI